MQPLMQARSRGSDHIDYTPTVTEAYEVPLPFPHRRRPQCFNCENYTTKPSRHITLRLGDRRAAAAICRRDRPLTISAADRATSHRRRSAKIGVEAYDATIELANIDQLKLDPTKREAIVRLIFVRTNYYWHSDYGSPTTRGLLMIGYANNPRDFSSGIPDFNRFVSLVECPPPVK